MRYDDKTFRFVGNRKQSYRSVFHHDTREHNTVLSDLARFCGAFDDPYDPDPRMQDIKIGRQQVWRRIIENLNVPAEELYRKYGGKLLPEEKA